MRKQIRLLWVAAFVFVQLSGFVSAQSANNPEHWVATWAASPQQPRVLAPPRGAAPAAPPAGLPVVAIQPATNPQRGPAAPAASAVAPNPQRGGPPVTSFNNQTVRMVLRASIGGRRVRVHLSNAYGTAPLAVGSARIALWSKDSEIVPGSDRPLRFSGKPSITIPQGASMISDPVDLNVAKLGDLVISIYTPAEIGTLTTHATALRTTYISKAGDLTAQPSIPDATTTTSWYWISGVEVMAPSTASAIVAFGDSITDGSTSTVNGNRSWPSRLAERLAAEPRTANIAVLNHGIAGNRFFADGAGVNALARFDRDVLSQSGVKWLIVLEAINDIGQMTGPNAPANSSLSADEVIGIYRQMIEKAHSQGIAVIGATLTPYEGATYYSEKGEVIRQAVNQWIRTSKAFDGVVDFDLATRDPNNPKKFKPGFNNGDNLHPNDEGYKAMAEKKTPEFEGK